MDPTDLKPMGVRDHCYANSVMDEDVSTHYVNSPLYVLLTERPRLSIAQEHDRLSWFDLEQFVHNDGFHKYMRIYISWLINAGINND
jgi:hypothetical protein